MIWQLILHCFAAFRKLEPRLSQAFIHLHFYPSTSRPSPSLLLLPGLLISLLINPRGTSPAVAILRRVLQPEVVVELQDYVSPGRREQLPRQEHRAGVFFGEFRALEYSAILRHKDGLLHVVPPCVEANGVL